MGGSSKNYDSYSRSGQVHGKTANCSKRDAQTGQFVSKKTSSGPKPIGSHPSK